MTSFYIASALAVLSVLYVLFLKREIDRAPAHVEPDIDGLVERIEAEIERDAAASARIDHGTGLNRGAIRRAA